LKSYWLRASLLGDQLKPIQLATRVAFSGTGFSREGAGCCSEALVTAIVLLLIVPTLRVGMPPGTLRVHAGLTPVLYGHAVF
jgi:hypothetical protein